MERSIRAAALNLGMAIERPNFTLKEAAHPGEEDDLALHDRHTR
jgi:hypothetical protein